jgi:hypothetical protein
MRRTLLSLLASFAAIPHLARAERSASGRHEVRDGRTNREAAVALRNAVLRRELFQDESGASEELGCVVMEWNIKEENVATIAAFDDGTVSMYYNWGGGILGAGDRPAVQVAAQRFRSEAARSRAHFRVTSSFPFPPSKLTAFYIVTRQATLLAGPFPERELSASNHRLSQLWSYGQELITAIRKASG